MRRLLAFLLFTLAVTTVSAAVRFNPYTKMWEGNICTNNYHWAYIQFQPIGSFCAIQLPNGSIVQGFVINQ